MTYNLSYIPNKRLYSAVSFALAMMRKGQPAYEAVYRAAGYYKVDPSDVGHYCGQAAGRISGQRRRK